MVDERGRDGRWVRLFADLEGQLDAADAAEFAAEVADRSRRESALVRLVDRLRAAVGADVGVRIMGLGLIEGRVVAVGCDWLLLGDAGRREVLVPLRAVLGVVRLYAQSETPHNEGVVAAKLDFAYVLRGIARDRAFVTLTFADGTAAAGTLDRVGADFLELAEHPAAEPRRREIVRGVRTVPFDAVVSVARLP